MVKELFKCLFHLARGNRGLSAWQQRTGVYLAQDIKLRLQNLIAKPIRRRSGALDVNIAATSALNLNLLSRTAGGM